MHAYSAPDHDLRQRPAGEILLHICCAPCATYPVERLRELGFTVRGYWSNPNIHPWQEHEARRLSLVGYAQRVDLPVEWEPGYQMVDFLRQVAGREASGDRCRVCYRLRLEAAAACASRLGIAVFTTTLLVSPYQDQALIREAGEAAADAHGVQFYFENFRRGWNVRSQRVREYDLYRQQYCGCLYSEFERYTKLPVGRAGEAPTC
ncbi:MAG: epoxyqueuosine reductase QueH [Anaerolineae bacterium]|nr:epoxyqueuosine reductase QueH [Anaerolineae bacterium]